MGSPAALPANLEVFSCERLSARLTVRSCGLRWIRVRAASPGQQDYDSACDRCPVGEHHATHGTRIPRTTQTPKTTQITTTQITTTQETESMRQRSNHTDDQQRAAVRRVLIDGETRTAVAADIGVSGTTVTNWVRRWGEQVSGAAIDAAAPARPEPAGARADDTVADDHCPDCGESDPECVCDEELDEEESLAEADDDEAELDPAPDLDPETEAEPSAREWREMPPLKQAVAEAAAPDLAVLDPYLPGIGVTGSTDARPAITWLADRLSRAVCRIPDRDARSAVADAAWLLAEAARG